MRRAEFADTADPVNDRYIEMNIIRLTGAGGEPIQAVRCKRDKAREASRLVRLWRRRTSLF